MIVPGKVSKEDKKNKKSSNLVEKILAEAQYYYEATEILEKEREKDKLFPPVIMNATFACELFSKAILYRKSEKEIIKGHSLKKLYDCFPDDVKTQISQLFHSMSEERLTKFIDDIDELFEFWRYRFEDCGYSTHYSFVLEYMKALNEVTKNLMGVEKK